MSCILLLFLPTSLFAWQWVDLWRTADQQGAELLQAGKAQQASQVFKNKDWQAVALYRAENYAQAFQQFKKHKTSDGQYNAGNAAAHLGRYQEALDAYDKAIALNPHNTDAITNREIIKKLLDKKNQQSHSANSNKSSASSSSKNEKKNTKNKSASNSPSSSPQIQDQNNSSQNNNAEKKNQQNNLKKTTSQDTKVQQQTDNIPTSPDNSSQPLSENKELDSKQEKINALAKAKRQAKEEDQKQLLRRLPDDPGGLLRQKFLRDYFRRHSDNNGEGGT